ILGAIVGLALRSAGLETVALTWIRPFGDIFMNLIRMLVVPLIFATLVAGMVAMGDPQQLGKLGLRTLSLYMVTTWIAVLLGLVYALILRPGAGIDVSTADAAAQTTIRASQALQDQAPGVVQRLIAIVPTNPVAALADGDVL